ncbi:MAG: phosphoribosyltransferase family protein [Mycoplasmatales bacterium]
MTKLQQKLVDSAQVIDNHIIKLDHLLNHNIDIGLLDEIAEVIAVECENLGIEKILTIETGGIGLATLVSIKLGMVDVVYAKKGKSLITTDENYEATVESFTKGTKFELSVSKSFLNKQKILIVDDFLATGSALNALLAIAKQADAEVMLSAFIINKTFQNNCEGKIFSILNVTGITDGKLKID